MIVRNSLANLVGQLLYPLLSIALVPFYLHYLGLEGYGLVGFFSMLVALLGVFTKGLGAALQREFARRDMLPEGRRSLRRLLRTFELVYWAIGTILGLGLIAFSGFVAIEWVRLDTIPPTTVRVCLLLISLRIALAFPNAVYQATFVGTQRQVLAGVLNASFALAGAASGVIVVLATRSIIGFYLSDVITACWSLLLLRHWAGKVLPPRQHSLKAAFDYDEVKTLWPISVGLIWTNGIGLIVTQLDRLVISNSLPVASLGIYSIGIAGGRLLGMSYGPFLQAVYPQTCQLAQRANDIELGRHLARNAKVVMIVCMAFGLPIVFFSGDILTLWTGNVTVAREGAAIMSLYLYGNIFIAYASVLYQAQMALGQTRFGILFNTVALVWFPPTVWFLVHSTGLIGAAWAWVLYSFASWLTNISVTLVVLLKKASLGSYIAAAVLTTGAGVALSLISRSLATSYFPDWLLARILVAGLGMAVTLGVCYVLCFGFRVPAELLEVMRKARPTLARTLLQEKR